jgi:hypothetical protein
MRQLFQDRIAAGNAVITAIENAIDPGVESHSTSVELTACGELFNITVTAVNANGGARAGLNDQIWLAAANEVLQGISGITTSDIDNIDAALLNYVAAANRTVGDNAA